MDVTLKRVSFSDNNVRGVLINDDTQDCLFVTIERPWKDNQHGISCIPHGDYVCKRINSPKHGNCFQVTGVKDRDMIEIHSANLASQLEGCIALGQWFGYVNGTPGIMNSKLSIDAFMTMQSGVDSFNLRIIEMK